MPGRAEATIVHTLSSLGWSAFFEQQLNGSSSFVPMRIAEEQRGHFRALSERGVHHAELAGRLRHALADGHAAPPCVGDWVLVWPPRADDAAVMIERVLERRSRFSRQAAGERTAEQVVAANIDTVFLVQSLNRDLNPRRLERYLALLWESGAEPVVVLSKSDLCADPEASLDAIACAAPGVSVHVTSAHAPDGLAALAPYLVEGRTVALVGSSGVGKSSIVNRLVGEEVMAVQDIRDDDRGRHTTTARQLVVLPTGGMVIDTPGMRTVLMWEGEQGLAQVFDDIDALARACRFTDCAHAGEPGCQVRAALADGTLDADRYRSYQKLQREIRHQAMKTDVALRRAEQRRWRQIHLENRRRPDKRRI